MLTHVDMMYRMILYLSDIQHAKDCDLHGDSHRLADQTRHFPSSNIELGNGTWIVGSAQRLFTPSCTYLDLTVSSYC